MDAVLARLEPVLSRQDGLVSLDQLRAAGIDRHTIDRLVRRKVLRRVRPRVFALVGAAESWERGLRAVVMSIEQAAASHSSGARLWMFAHQPESRYEVSVPRTVYAALRGTYVHRTSVLEDEDVGVRAGIRCTTFERTLCDCTALLSEFQMGRTLDDGLRRGVASLRRLERCAERLESGPGRRMSVIRAALATRGRGYDPGGSNAERRVLEVLGSAGLPLPTQQHVVRIGLRRYVLDYAYADVMVLVEYYGLAVHMGASSVAYDNERLTALVAAGWLPLVFTDASSDREIVERVRAALELRHHGGKKSA